MKRHAGSIVGADGEVHSHVITALVFSTALDDLCMTCDHRTNEVVVHFGSVLTLPYSKALAAVVDHRPALERLNKAVESLMSSFSSALLSQRRLVDFDLTGQSLPPKR
jgi:hypothetical protein